MGVDGQQNSYDHLTAKGRQGHRQQHWMGFGSG
jgi:hypothetical protein